MPHAPILAAFVPLLSVAACAPPPDARHHMPQTNPEQGRTAMEQAGCGACHSIPGVWPEGTVGPPLKDLADQALIAGRLPNRPDILTSFIRDAPRWLPGTTMPSMPLTEEEARDAAAYLYGLGDR